MERKTFDIQEMKPKTVEFMLYILSRDLLPCNQPDIYISRNKPLYISVAWKLVSGPQK